MTLSSNLNIANILSSASPEIKAQILIDNEIDALLNNDLTIKRSEVEMLEQSLKSTNNQFAYSRYAPVTKDVMQVAIVSKHDLNHCELLMNALEAFLLLVKFRIKLEKSLKKAAKKFDDSDIERSDEATDEIYDVLFDILAETAPLLNLGKESEGFPYNLEGAYNKVESIMIRNFKDIGNSISYFEMIKKNYDFNVPAIDKNINSIKKQVADYQARLDSARNMMGVLIKMEAGESIL